MTTKKLLLGFVSVLLLVSNIVNAQNSAPSKAYSDDWVATDGAGRTLPTHADVGDFKPNKYVGVFYWLWHSYIRTNPIRNMTEELRRTNGNPNFVAQDWYWAEPENGYYHNSDPWVIRRHLQMFANAGVDFLYIDYTNGPIGEQSFTAFMDIALSMQNQGIPVPKIVFFTNDENGRTAMDFVYNNVYLPQKYKSLWFYWEGKPLIMEDQIHASSTAISNFFTFRHTWAFQASTTDQWRFIDNYPQRPSYHNGVPEQICVNKGMGAPLIPVGGVNDKGSSYTKASGTPPYNSVWETARSAYGDYFEEEWGRVHEVNPSIVCVSGFNEWTAGQWQTTDPGMSFMGKPCSDIKWFMVDEFNVEFNRDVEPVKGEYTDNYYYQMLGHIRKHKGMKPTQTPSAPKVILIDGVFSEWSSVFPLFNDPQGDTQHRNFQNVNNSGTYVNTTGRNDIIENRTTFDAQNVYFYVKTATNITPYTDPNWMLLLIDSDKNKATGWEGYDFAVNKEVISNTSTTLKSWNGTGWQNVATINFSYVGNEMEIAIPRTLLGKTSSDVSFNYKFSDNQGTSSIQDFFVNGDAAPDRRFNFAFSSNAGTVARQPFKGILPIPGKIEAEDFDIGGQNLSYFDSDPANNGAQYRTTESVDIEICTEGGYDVGWIATGEWMEYTVNVATTGNYQASVRVAGPNDNTQFHIAFDGVDKSGIITVNKTAGFQNWTTINKTVTLTSGVHTMRFFVDQTSGFNINNFTFTSAGAPDLGTGTGLTGNYFNDSYAFNVSSWSSSTTETGAWNPPSGINWFSSPVGTRTDASINVPKGGLETFLTGVTNLNKQAPVSIRWTGSIEFLYEGTYTFYLSGADGLRLNVNKQNVIGTFAAGDPAWVVRPYLEKSTNFAPLSGTFNVTAGMAKTKIPVTLEFFSAGATQWSQLTERGLKLEWESNVQAKGIVPQSQLYLPSLVTSFNSQADLENVIRVYPNPVDGEKFYVHLPDYNQEIEWQILRPSGEVVATGKLNHGNRSGIPSPATDGLYILHLTGNDFTHFTKLIIAR
jgi:hypothetical protein